jgi:hypothetical protein
MQTFVNVRPKRAQSDENKSLSGPADRRFDELPGNESALSGLRRAGTPKVAIMLWVLSVHALIREPKKKRITAVRPVRICDRHCMQAAANRTRLPNTSCAILDQATLNTYIVAQHDTFIVGPVMRSSSSSIGVLSATISACSSTSTLKSAARSMALCTTASSSQDPGIRTLCTQSLATLLCGRLKHSWRPQHSKSQPVAMVQD